MAQKAEIGALLQLRTLRNERPTQLEQLAGIVGASKAFEIVVLRKRLEQLGQSAKWRVKI
jgi:hypothetical protein